MAGPELTALINGNYSSEGKNKVQWAHVPFRTVDEDSQPVKIDLSKKFFPKQKTIQNFIIDAQGFIKTRNENPPTREIGVAS